MTALRKIFTTLCRSRELHFLILAGSSALCFFLATVILLTEIPTSEFAAVASVLAIGLIVANLLQFGADSNLPRHARSKDGDLRSPVTAHFLIMGGISIVCLLFLLAASGSIRNDFQWILSWSLVFGIAGSLQLICDAFLRSRNEIFRIATANIILGITSVALIMVLALKDILTADIFLSILLTVKLVFALLVICRPVFRLTLNTRSVLDSLKRTPIGFIGAVSLLSLGLLDNMLLLSQVDVPAVASYISAKHFAYGVYLAAVQDGCMPILIAFLVRNNTINLYHLSVLCLALSCAVFMASLSIGLLITSGDTFTTTSRFMVVAIAATGVAIHTLAAFSLRTLLVVQTSNNWLCIATLSAAAVMVITVLTLTKLQVMMVGVIWMSFNIWVTARAFLLIQSTVRQSAELHSQFNHRKGTVT